METLVEAASWAVSGAKHMYAMPGNFREEYASWLMDNYPDYGAYATVLYLWVVFRLPKIMEKRKALSLWHVTFVWNISLSIFSIMGTWSLVPTVLAMLQERGLHRVCCVFDLTTYHGPTGFWLIAFGYSKTPELLDTLFLILQKKPVSFLHWYHHLVTALFCWHASYVVISTDILFATMNFGVHSIMYLYYAIVSLGYRRVIRPIAPLITTLQILQMFAGTYITVYTAYHYYVVGGCNYNETSLRMGLLMYGSYCLLFCVLFKELYLDRPLMATKRQSPQRLEKGDVRNEG